jgi:dienelactone hydrolase
LPVLALHDLAGSGLGRSSVAALPHPMVEQHQQALGRSAGGRARPRGYAVLCHDVFTFGSRRIRATDLPDLVVERMMGATHRELAPGDRAGEGAGTAWDVPPDAPSERVERYHAFAAQHESIVAKSLFSAGLTWPGVVLAEDRAALAYLAARDDVDAGRLACCGLSGGGLRTCFLAGMDGSAPRSRSASSPVADCPPRPPHPG